MEHHEAEWWWNTLKMLSWWTCCVLLIFAAVPSSWCLQLQLLSDMFIIPFYGPIRLLYYSFLFYSYSWGLCSFYMTENSIKWNYSDPDFCCPGRLWTVLVCQEDDWLTGRTLWEGGGTQGRGRRKTGSVITALGRFIGCLSVHFPTALRILLRTSSWIMGAAWAPLFSRLCQPHGNVAWRVRPSPSLFTSDNSGVSFISSFARSVRELKCFCWFKHCVLLWASLFSCEFRDTFYLSFRQRRIYPDPRACRCGLYPFVQPVHSVSVFKCAHRKAVRSLNSFGC